MPVKSVCFVFAAAGMALALVANAQDVPTEITIDPMQLMEGFPDPSDEGIVTVDGLDMYYQVHGEGEPLVLIHGGLMTIEAWGPFVSALAQSRTVYAIELEGHGRTVDLDRPLSIRQFADDVGGFIDAMEIGPVDVVGYSMGGGTAIGVGVLHPEQVKSLVVISASYQFDSIWDSVRAGWPYMTAEMMEGTPMEAAYDLVAPQPERFEGFVDKIRESMLVEEDVWTEDEIASVTAPVLMMVGDHDLIQLDKALEMYRLLGGQTSTGPMGPDLDLERQFSVIPGATHYDIYFKTELIMPAITGFFAAQSTS